jgi:hypothetical protein
MSEVVFPEVVFPHCNPKVLHAPGECRYCDDHPDWQKLRKAWELPFSDYDPNGWGGNRAAPANGIVRGWDYAGYEVVESRSRFKERVRAAANALGEILSRD